MDKQIKYSLKKLASEHFDLLQQKEEITHRIISIDTELKSEVINSGRTELLMINWRALRAFTRKD